MGFPMQQIKLMTICQTERTKIGSPTLQKSYYRKRALTKVETQLLFMQYVLILPLPFSLARPHFVGSFLRRYSRTRDLSKRRRKREEGGGVYKLSVMASGVREEGGGVRGALI